MRDDIRCPNPKCHDGAVHYRGTGTGDDPSQDVDCPCCDGSGRVHAKWAYRVRPGRCDACGGQGLVNGAKLCHPCWTRRYRPECLPAPIALAEIPF